MAIAKSRAAFVLCALALCGCAGTAMPTWRAVGSAEYQRKQAERYDPYPENDIAPVVEGGRPPGYEVPPPEVTRARQQIPHL